MMASDSTENLSIINEDYQGLHLLSGPPQIEQIETFSGRTRALTISKDGNYIAFSDNVSTKVVDLNDRSVKFTQDIPGVQFVDLSPKNNFLQAWVYTKNATDHNLMIYDIKSNTLVQTMKQKQAQWRLHWTDDESICVRFFNEELHFYENNDFTRYIAKFYTQKVADFSLTTHVKSGVHYFACLSIGTHGQPNFVKLYRYPQMETAIAIKSFFRTDRTTFKWRSRGDAVLILCAADVDKTGKSYYGEQNLNYMDVNGKAFAVTLDKEGPIHAVEWHPSTTETLFCVSYGFVPPKLAFVDSDGRIIHSFGEMHINQIHFNPFGNLVIFAGFGNLRGGLSVYNSEKKTLLAQLTSPDTTYINWAPDGAHLLTAVTSPRMRVGNCLRVWHYSGKLIGEIQYPDGDSLFRSIWRPNRDDFPNAPMITETGIKASNLGKEAEPKRYVPPHLRNSGATLEATTSGPLSKSSANLRSKGPKGRGGRRGGGGGDRQAKPPAAKAPEASEASAPTGATSGSESNDKDNREKKVKAIEKKLEAIKNLKTVRSSGGQLQRNQLVKISKEKELLAELKKLQIVE